MTAINAHINQAQHAPNCLVSLKTWAAQDPEEHCDCELGTLKRRIVDLELTIKHLDIIHPRAMKLMRKKKDFVVIADDEPYYRDAYKTIRANEQKKGTWTPEDENAFRAKMSEDLY